MCLNKHVCFWTCEKYYYIFKCLKGSWSWMHSQQLETRPIRIKPELDFSKTKLDPPKQILIVASTLLGFLLATDPQWEQDCSCCCDAYSYCWRKLTSVVWALPPELCSRCRVVGVPGNYRLHSCYPWGELAFSPKEPFSVIPDRLCVYIYLLT